VLVTVVGSVIDVQHIAVAIAVEVALHLCHDALYHTANTYSVLKHHNNTYCLNTTTAAAQARTY
jgi:hypothetical protein